MTRSLAGFSLIESLTVLAVGSLLLGAAISGFAGVTDRNRISAEHNRLTATFNLARTLAVTRRQRTVVCPSVDGRICRRDAIWEAGWIVFADADADRQLDPSENALRHETASVDLRIRGSVARGLVVFLPNGSARGSNQTLRLCDSDGAPLAGLVLNNGGRSRKASAREAPGLAPCG